MPSFFDFEGRLRRRWPTGWRIYREIQRLDLGFMANSVAFQTFTALLPLFVVVFVLVSVVAGDALAEQVLSFTESFLPEQTRRTLATAIATELGTSSTSVVGVAVLLWGALNLFKGLDTAFSKIYRTAGEKSLVEETRDALVVFGVLLVALVGSVFAGGLAVLDWLPFTSVLVPVALVVGLTVVFLPMYTVFPDTDVGLRQALPGVAVAAVGWTVLESLFGLYVEVTVANDPLGAVGAILLLLSWIYVASFLILLGAVVNEVLADRPTDAAVERTAVDAPE